MQGNKNRITEFIEINLFNYILNPDFLLSVRKFLTVDKCWYASSLSILMFQQYDATYYDGKISILMWILIAGLKTIFDKRNKVLTE